MEILSRDERINSGEGSELRWRFENHQPEGDMNEFIEDYANSFWDNPNRCIFRREKVKCHAVKVHSLKKSSL